MLDAVINYIVHHSLLNATISNLLKSGLVPLLDSRINALSLFLQDRSQPICCDKFYSRWKYDFCNVFQIIGAVGGICITKVKKMIGVHRLSADVRYTSFSHAWHVIIWFFYAIIYFGTKFETFFVATGRTSVCSNLDLEFPGCMIFWIKPKLGLVLCIELNLKMYLIPWNGVIPWNILSKVRLTSVMNRTRPFLELAWVNFCKLDESLKC